ncbi:carboxypeptidase B-like [Haliotis cracherodii]|uniref:carboxypeptidase B-like n=1 Tax=Haliotis cracherodii TaxID=6455 RepID=UPI0039EA6C00
MIDRRTQPQCWGISHRIDMKVLALLIVLGVYAVAAKQSFHGHRLVSVIAKNKEQLDVLNGILRTGEPWVDVWSFSGINRTSEIRVPPSSYGLFSRLMRTANIPITIMENDIEMLLERARQPSLGPHEKASPYISWSGGYTTHTAYKRYQSFVDIMDGMKSSFPNLVQEVGSLSPQTYEGRNIAYIKFGTGGSKPAIFIESLIHAREWISGGSIMYFMDRLVSRYSLDADARYMLDNYDIYVVPVSNPDGYEYTHTSNRLWRKNRSQQQGNCRGVDLNRNFDAYWNTVGVSNQCSSDIYCGNSMFSEAEAQAIRNKVAEINSAGQKLLAYLAVHSYSQLLLTPYSYANVRPENAGEVDNVARLMNDALKAPFGSNYQWGHGPDVLYPVSGASDDWAMLGGGARYVYTYELRPRSSNPGFSLGPEHIIPNGYEFWLSMVAMACNMNAGAPSC